MRERSENLENRLRQRSRQEVKQIERSRAIRAEKGGGGREGQRGRDLPGEKRELEISFICSPQVAAEAGDGSKQLLGPQRQASRMASSLYANSHKDT